MVLVYRCRYKCLLCWRRRFEDYSSQDFIAEFGFRYWFCYLLKNDCIPVDEICYKCHKKMRKEPRPEEPRPEEPRQQKKIVIHRHYYYAQPQNNPPRYAELPV